MAVDPELIIYQEDCAELLGMEWLHKWYAWTLWESDRDASMECEDMFDRAGKCGVLYSEDRKD